MRIRVDRDGTTTLAEPDDFGGFSVELLADDPLALSAIDRLGSRVGDTHVFVEEEALLRLAGGRANDDAWRASLASMKGYASDHGFLDDEGRIRAHVVRP